MATYIILCKQVNGDTFESTLPTATGMTQLQTNDCDAEDETNCSHRQRHEHRNLDCKASSIYENRFNYIGKTSLLNNLSHT